MDSQSLSMAHAMAAPKPPAVVNSVDKTTVSKARQTGPGESRLKDNIRVVLFYCVLWTLVSCAHYPALAPSCFLL